MSTFSGLLRGVGQSTVVVKDPDSGRSHRITLTYDGVSAYPGAGRYGVEILSKARGNELFKALTYNCYEGGADAAEVLRQNIVAYWQKHPFKPDSVAALQFMYPSEPSAYERERGITQRTAAERAVANNRRMCRNRG